VVTNIHFVTRTEPLRSDIESVPYCSHGIVAGSSNYLDSREGTQDQAKSNKAWQVTPRVHKTNTHSFKREIVFRKPAVFCTIAHFSTGTKQRL